MAGALILPVFNQFVLMYVKPLFGVSLPIPEYMFMLLMALGWKMLIVTPMAYLAFTVLLDLFGFLGKGVLFAGVAIAAFNFNFIFDQAAAGQYTSVSAGLIMVINGVLSGTSMVLACIGIFKKSPTAEYVSSILLFTVLSCFAFPIEIRI